MGTLQKKGHKRLEWKDLWMDGKSRRINLFLIEIDKQNIFDLVQLSTEIVSIVSSLSLLIFATKHNPISCSCPFTTKQHHIMVDQFQLNIFVFLLSIVLSLETMKTNSNQSANSVDTLTLELSMFFFSL